MKTIAIPLLKTENSIGAVGPIEILTKTCALWRELTKRRSGGPLFDVQIVGERRRPVTFANGITLHPSATVSEVKPDLVVVPSIDEELDSALKKNQAYVEWVRDSFQRGAHLSSLCTGAFVLAAAGVLDGRRATTHWFSPTSSGADSLALTSRNAICWLTRAISSPAGAPLPSST